jgi:membrane protein DedA with SNARE-associated domain
MVMIDYIEWLRLFILSHQSFEYGIILLATALGGELVLFFLGFLIAQSVLPIFPTVLISFFGAFLPNILWFFLGKTKMMEKSASHKYTNATFLVITEAVQRVSRGSHLIALIIIKFLVGTPILLVIYTHKTLLSVRQFFYYQSVAMFLSVIVIMFIGYVGGRGFSYITEISQNLYTTLGFILFFVFIISISQVWFEKMFTRKKD